MLARTFGCCRFVYNWALRQKTDAFSNEQQRLSYKDLSEALTQLKKQEDIIVWSRPLPDGAKPDSVTVTKDCADCYFISILVEEDITQLPRLDTAIGVDLELKSFVVLSDGEDIGNPTFLRKEEKKLARAQRRHAKKKKGSKNRAKARKKEKNPNPALTSRLMNR